MAEVGSDGVVRAAPGRPAHEWTLWAVAASCALHPLEEYFTGWQGWAKATLGIVVSAPRFVVANTVLVVAAVLMARTGWRRPVLALTIPAATLVNAIFFHILPTLVQHQVSPGVYTATLLYLPFSSWAYLGAWRDGVPRRALAAALVAGTLLMLAVVAGARASPATPDDADVDRSVSFHVVPDDVEPNVCSVAPPGQLGPVLMKVEVELTPAK